MTPARIHLIGGIGAAVLAAAGAGFGVARMTGRAPAVAATSTEEVHQATPGAVAMTAAVRQASGITVAAAEASALAHEILAQGTVTAAPGGEAQVSARAAGAVTRVFVRLGDPVRRGQVLAVVESREAAQIAADRTVAQARAALAQRTLARERSLFEQGVTPRMDYERAQAEAVAAQAETRRSQITAGAARLTADGRGVLVISPISGHVTVTAAAIGTFVQPETALFRVADPSLVQVEVALPQADAARVRPGDRALVDAGEGRVLEGSVRSVTPSLHAVSRTATAVLDMGPASLPPGHVVQVRIFPPAAVARTTVVVPDEAIQSVDGRDVVFVQTPQGFRAQPIVRGQTSAGRTEIASGLRAGQSIATRNAFLLKAELGRGEGDDD